MDEGHSTAAILEHFLKVCDAAHYAHSKGVVHRDLKPQNILVGRYNDVYLVDWGIAKLLSQSSQASSEGAGKGEAQAGEHDTVRLSDEAAEAHPRTQQGDLLGTLGYMSPEQIRGDVDEIRATSDVFCLGLILYEIVTLERAYPRGARGARATAMANAQLAPMEHSSLSGAAAKEVEAIVARACALAPDDRYESAEALANDIRRFLRGEEVSVRRDTPARRIARWVGHHREATLGLVLLLVLAGAATATWSLYERQRVIVAAQAHENRVASHVTSVAERAQVIERHFLGFEAMVEGLAAAATQLMVSGEPGDDPTYTDGDFTRPGGGPPDYEQSGAYAMRISLDWPVFKPAPGADPAELAEAMRKLSPLRHHYKQMLFASVAGGGWGGDEPRVREQIMGSGAALTWAYVGLAAGLHVAYPGKTGYPVEYDPRKRPWYRHSADNQGTAWLPPYVDVNGRGLVVPCTRPLRDPAGALIGVAGVEMTLDHIRKNLLNMTGMGGIESTYLVDEAGRVVASSGAVTERFAAGTLIEDLADLDIYSVPDVVGEILAAQSGHLVRPLGDGTERLFVYQRLGSVRWYLVAEARIEG